MFAAHSSSRLIFTPRSPAPPAVAYPFFLLFSFVLLCHSNTDLIKKRKKIFMSHSKSVVRKLLDLRSVELAPDGEALGLSVVSRGRSVPRGFASESECRQIVSPSFVQVLQKILPIPPLSSPDRAAFGGAWFWEGYRHGLAGEHLLIDLAGTGIDLGGDTLDHQVRVRAKCIEACSAAAAAPAPWSSCTHVAAKLEVMLSTAMSVALHVSQQPLLEAHEGPQAVILCASKDQCDDFAFALGRFCDELHLVVHNLFEPYPSIPPTKRPEVVVGTPPLWDSVASLASGGEAPSDLEAILCRISGNPTAPTYARTKWRPYSSERVSQVVVFDLERQLACGFHGMLRRWTASGGSHGTSTTTSESPLTAAASPPWQLYVVYGCASGAHATSDMDAEKKRLLAEVDSAGAACGYGSVCISACLAGPSSSAQPSSRKRALSGGEEDPAVSGTDGAGCALLLRGGALSYPRLVADPGALADLERGLLTEAGAFWGAFDGVGCVVPADAMRAFISVRLVFLCDAPTHTDDSSGTVAASSSTRAPRLRETCALVQSVEQQRQQPPSSRALLLLRHLEEKLAGTIFDGCAIQCSLVAVVPAGSTDTNNDTDTDTLASRLHLVADVVLPFMVGTGVAGTAGPAPPPCFMWEELPSEEAVERSQLDLTDARLRAFEHASPPLPSLFPAESPASSWLPHCAALIEEFAPREAFTVVALRGIVGTVADLCGRDSVATAHNNSNKMKSHAAAVAAPPRKPHALYVLEECCQYGKVISYYCYQTPGCNDTSSSSSSGSRRAGDDATTTTTATSSSASMFVEFAFAGAALEAARMFAARFATTAATTAVAVTPPPPPPRVHMMRNSVYYAGVAQETSPASDGDSDDSLFDVPLLAE